MDESGIESARMSLRRGRRSARATIALAVVCVIAALVASYRSWHQEAADSSPRLALSQPSQVAQPPKPPPVEPLTAVESHRAQSRRQGTLASPRSRGAQADSGAREIRRGRTPHPRRHL